MAVNISLKQLVDLENYDYFYHMTSEENAEGICEDGLFVDGTNILETNNIIYTTAVPIDEDILKNFDYILEDEMGNTDARSTDACVIIGAPKEYNKRVVEEYKDYHDGVYYDGIVYNSMIMGYFDLRKEFHPNENYIYYDEIYDNIDDYDSFILDSKRR